MGSVKADAARAGCFPFRRGSKELLAARPPGTPASTKAGGYQGENPVNDLRSLEEALMAFSEEPPHVARSTPKGLFLRSSPAEQEKRDRSCIYQPAVYDAMLQQSLDTVAALQLNLDTLMDEVRSAPTTLAAPSPVPCTQPLSLLADSGQGTSLSGNESLSPLPNGTAHQGSSASVHSRPASPTKTVSFVEPPPPTLEPKANKRRVIRMVNF